jgi:ribosomal protein S18 acetylase RimI-like enzyme
MTSLKFEIYTQEVPPEAEFVKSQLVAFNNQKFGTFKRQELSIIAKDDFGSVQAGLVGSTNWDWMYVQLTWVSDNLRGQGAGSRLMDEAEKIAVARGCVGIWLDTFSAEAKHFYEQRGYEVFGQLDNFPPAQCRFFLKKNLR